MGVIIQKSEYPCHPSERGKRLSELKKTAQCILVMCLGDMNI
ncbi:hypothetical protein IFVP408_C2120167 [Vibrio parahaemolyticus]